MEALQPLTIEDLEPLWRKMPNSKAKGVDVLGPTDLQRLPLAGKHEIVTILNDVEEVGSWPVQFLLTLCATLPKAAGGDRIIGVLPKLMGLWSRARSGATDSWADSRNDFWDTAVRNSSALRAALQRSVMDEAAHELGFGVAVLLLDLENAATTPLF